MSNAGNLVITYEEAGEPRELAIPNAPANIDEGTALLYVLQQHGGEHVELDFPPHSDELNKRRLRAQKLNLLNIDWTYR
ncbi:hypothetical protein ACFQDN_14010 [Pseudomonas asuensis]|jgi:hypothetical protein|uniref:YcgL domain-containing protein n=1 Tax=Pseudomonas asuensis TaxID=1825787 RepID=A0ABQ2H1Y2_9PSED|nr:hypothetical protein [Pseudomonas asuensis]GGM22997.1 hypothetical protein GCM10009425_37310 [Pseudomonas asuensis]